MIFFAVSARWKRLQAVPLQASPEIVMVHIVRQVQLAAELDRTLSVLARAIGNRLMHIELLYLDLRLLV